MAKISSRRIQASHSLVTEVAQQYDCTEGIVNTDHGYVKVWQAEKHHTRSESFVNFEFIHKGREYFLQLAGKPYTHRGLVMHARKFARWVVFCEDKDNE